MTSNLILDLAHRGARFPIGTDLVLRESPDAEQVLLNGPALGAVMELAADRYGSPLALPVMDLTVEKTDLLTTFFGVSAEDALTYHFDALLSTDVVEEVHASIGKPLSPRLDANVRAIEHVASRGVKFPVGMAIGPFSLMSKLIANPIEPVYMAGMGMTGEDDDEILLVERALEVSMAVILRSLEAQIQAGAKAVFIAEPAANVAYLSPNQIEAGSDIYERFVMEPNRRIAEILKRHGVLELFHCCGELIDPMVEAFSSLQPALLSLGSSRDLKHDASLVSKDVVLYGNLPSKRFYDDTLCSLEATKELSRKIASDMSEAGHPFILGTECDVLSVPGAEATIKEKVAALLAA